MTFQYPDSGKKNGADILICHVIKNQRITKTDAARLLGKTGASTLIAMERQGRIVRAPDGSFSLPWRAGKSAARGATAKGKPFCFNLQGFNRDLPLPTKPDPVGPIISGNGEVGAALLRIFQK